MVKKPLQKWKGFLLSLAWWWTHRELNPTQKGDKTSTDNHA